MSAEQMELPIMASASVTEITKKEGGEEKTENKEEPKEEKEDIKNEILNENDNLLEIPIKKNQEKCLNNIIHKCKKIHNIWTILSICFIVLLINLAFTFFFFSKIENQRIKATMLFDSNIVYNIYLKKVRNIESSFSAQKMILGGTVIKSHRLTPEEEKDIALILTVAVICYKNFDDNVFFAMISSESGWDKNAKSKRGARGLCQIMPDVFEEINKTKLDKYGNYDIYEVYHNVEAGSRIMQYLYNTLRYRLRREPKAIELAWGYNAGITITLQAITSGELSNYLPRETILYGEKLLFYYTNYRNDKYDVYLDR